MERDLAAEMGVSRIPVRDALRILVAEGLVTPRPALLGDRAGVQRLRRGRLIEVRAALETLAFRLAAQRRSREGLARLGAALDTELDAARRGRAVAARRAGAAFHEVVTDLAANEMLSELERTIFAGESAPRWSVCARHPTDARN